MSSNKFYELIYFFWLKTLHIFKPEFHMDNITEYSNTLRLFWEWFLCLLLLLLIITFMQGIYNYIPEINHASMVYSVAAIL
jgi:hypothetical protein